MGDTEDTPKLSFFAKKFGVNLSAAVISAAILGVSATALAIRDSVIVSELDRNGIRADVAELRSEFNGFKNVGDRFTAANGAELRTRIEKLETAVAGVSERCVETRLRVQSLESRFDRVCTDVSACVSGTGGNHK